MSEEDGQTQVKKKHPPLGVSFRKDRPGHACHAGVVDRLLGGRGVEDIVEGEGAVGGQCDLVGGGVGDAWGTGRREDGSTRNVRVAPHAAREEASKYANGHEILSAQENLHPMKKKGGNQGTGGREVNLLTDLERLPFDMYQKIGNIF